VSESDRTEIQYWQSVVDDLRVSGDALREQLEALRTENEGLHLQNKMQEEELKQLRSMLQRIQIAMSQGVEL
jgi:chaperonin cofactor prefoldin